MNTRNDLLGGKALWIDSFGPAEVMGTDRFLIQMEGFFGEKITVEADCDGVKPYIKDLEEAKKGRYIFKLTDRQGEDKGIFKSGEHYVNLCYSPVSLEEARCKFVGNMIVNKK